MFPRTWQPKSHMLSVHGMQTLAFLIMSLLHFLAACVPRLRWLASLVLRTCLGDVESLFSSHLLHRNNTLRSHNCSHGILTLVLCTSLSQFFSSLTWTAPLLCCNWAQVTSGGAIHQWVRFRRPTGSPCLPLAFFELRVPLLQAFLIRNTSISDREGTLNTLTHWPRVRTLAQCDSETKSCKLSWPCHLQSFSRGGA